jgi:hypothetical protein
MKKIMDQSGKNEPFDTKVASPYWTSGKKYESQIQQVDYYRSKEPLYVFGEMTERKAGSH